MAVVVRIFKNKIKMMGRLFEAILFFFFFFFFISSTTKPFRWAYGRSGANARCLLFIF